MTSMREHILKTLESEGITIPKTLDNKALQKYLRKQIKEKKKDNKEDGVKSIRFGEEKGEQNTKLHFQRNCEVENVKCQSYQHDSGLNSCF